jgi:N-acetylglucosaminyl-diphospho-decaprenol L-rhamnosyltransferase
MVSPDVAIQEISQPNGDTDAIVEPIQSDVELPDVTVIIVSYNTRDWLAKCLSSVRDASPRHRIEVIVVDNASHDDSANVASASYPGVQLVQNATNIGFGRAVNVGAKAARGRYLVLLNPDGMLAPSAIDNLVNFAEANPDHVVVGGKTMTPDGHADPRSCWGAPTMWSLFCSATLLSTLRPRSRFDPESLGWYQRDRPQVVDIVSGCLMLVRTKDWRLLDGFDERYFLYGEDADFCLRASELTGRTCAVTPDAVMVHAVSASSASAANKKVFLLRGRITVAQTHLKSWQGRLGPSLIVVGVAVRAMLEHLGVARRAGWRDAWARRADWRRGYVKVT